MIPSATSETFWARLGASSWATALVSLAFVRLLIVPGLYELILTTGWQIPPYTRVLCTVLPWGVVMLLLLPSVVVGSLLPRWGYRRTASIVQAVLAALVFFVVLADGYLYRAFGRHLRDLWVYAELPEGRQAAGALDVWIWRSLFWLACAAMASALLAISTHLLARLAPRLSTALRVLGSLLGVTFSLLLASTPWFLPTSLPEGIRPRLTGALLFDPTSTLGSGTHTDPELRELERQFNREYASKYAYVFGPPDDPRKLVQPNGHALPNVSLVVAESLRADVFGPRLMPRLSHWAEGGLLLEQHYSGSNHSETGLFSLLFGRSVLTYHTTLNAKGRPALCEALRQLGYRCGYFTGHPKRWVRREEFLNPSTMDVFAHDDHGDWNEWDERALRRAKEFLDGGERRIAITFLMSSHYEYRYPAAHRRHLPDTQPRVPWASMKASQDEFVTSRNRYENVVGYVDEIVGAHVEGLDDETLAIFTGDHGEETGENGRFGHGYGFSDPLVRVPMILRGAGMGAGTRKERSVHQDILPTVLSLLGQPASQGVGQSLLAPEAPRSLLLAYTKQDFRTATALLLACRVRVALTLDLEATQLRVVGFEDALGRPIIVPKVDTPCLVRAFADQLARAGRPLP